MFYNLRIVPLISFIACFFLFGCQPKQPEPTTEEPVLLRVEIDSTGKVTDAAVVGFLTKLAVLISKNGDRIMLHSYTESTGNPETETALANQQAQAAKQVMVDTDLPRMYYNVGIDVHGATNPLPGKAATDVANRRIEIEFL